MYTENDWLQSISAHSAGIGAATAVALLCEKLAAQKLLNGTDVEELRLAALMNFDGVQEKRKMSNDAKQRLENLRKGLDGAWHRAALSASP